MSAGPSQRTLITVIERDGLYCRYCGFGPMPVQWEETRSGNHKLYRWWTSRVKGGRVLELDHIVAKSRGGSDRPDNLVVACWKCNNAKGNKAVHGPLRRPWPISLPPKPAPIHRPFRRQEHL